MIEDRWTLDDSADQPWWSVRRGSESRPRADEDTARSLRSSEIARVQRRYALAPSLAALLDVLLDDVRERFPFERVAAVAGHDGLGLCHGVGVTRDEADAFKRAYLDGAQNSPERGIEGGRPVLTSWHECVIVPVNAFGTSFSAAVAVETAEHHPALEGVGSALDFAAPFLARGAELHALRARAGQLEEATRRAHRALDDVADPVLVLDTNGRVSLSNKRARELLLRSPSDPEERRRALETNNLLMSAYRARASLESEMGRAPGELVLVDPDTGSDLRFRVSTAPLPDFGSGLGESVLVLRDVSDVQRAVEERVREATGKLTRRNQELVRQRDELTQASRMKSEFLATMSHELRTPINAILGYNSLLRERLFGELTERQEDSLRRMRSAADHLLSIVNDVLDLSRVEAGKLQLSPSEVRLDQFLPKVCESMKLPMAEKGLEYVVEVHDDTPAIVTDRTRLRQVVLNLISNAIKFTEVGTVTARAAPTSAAGRVCIEVSDTGIGIAEEHLETIFEEFAQVDRLWKRTEGGMGLGLPISRKLTELLGGELSVRSTVGVGTTFTVELPVEPPDTADPGA